MLNRKSQSHIDVSQFRRGERITAPSHNLFKLPAQVRHSINIQRRAELTALGLSDSPSSLPYKRIDARLRKVAMEKRLEMWRTSASLSLLEATPDCHMRAVTSIPDSVETLGNLDIMQTRALILHRYEPYRRAAARALENQAYDLRDLGGPLQSLIAMSEIERWSPTPYYPGKEPLEKYAKNETGDVGLVGLNCRFCKEDLLVCV